MPFTLIKGEFVPEAGRPDGDSMRFRPADPNPLFLLRRRGAAPKVNQNNGTIQLRFEGIDTMESKALEPFSSDATKSNLALCGIPSGSGTAPGYILTNQIGPNGRPISFVFAGQTDEADGASVFLDENKIEESVNFKQLSLGHAYPLFYDTLFSDLRSKLTGEVEKARAGNLGVWRADETNTGAQYSGALSLEKMNPIFPKLWRRLDNYSRDRDTMNNESLGEFREYLESIREERVFILSEARSTGFDDIVIIEGNVVKLAYEPEDIVVMSA